MNISFCRRKSINVLLITLWFGLLMGLLEVLLLLVKQQLFHVYIFRSRDYLWLTPLANVFLFSVPGLLMFLVAIWSPRMVPIPGLAFFYSFLGAASLLIEIEKFTRPVVVFIALMVAINVARVIYMHEVGFINVVRKTTIWFIGTVFIFAIFGLLIR